jgi:hypothetical protein
MVIKEIVLNPDQTYMFVHKENIRYTNLPQNHKTQQIYTMHMSRKSI